VILVSETEKIAEGIEGKEVTPREELEQEGQVIGETGKKAMEKKFGSDKPEFKRPIECVVTEASFQTDGSTVTTTHKNGKEVQLSEDKHYKKHWLSCTFEYVDKESGEIMCFDQTFGSIREYSNRLWMGAANNLAQLKSLLEAYVGVSLDSPWDIAKEIKGKKCLVKSMPWEFENNKGFSNLVQDFVDEKEAMKGV